VSALAEALQAVSAAERKLAGARYDLTRKDKHPNDLHKAQAKLTQAGELITAAQKAVS
jgi:hypothetical protein